VLPNRADGGAPAPAVLLEDGEAAPTDTGRNYIAIAVHLTAPTVQREKPKALRVMRQALQDLIHAA
jgi:hypothetical protein